MSTAESHGHDHHHDHSHGLVRDANKKEGRQGFMILVLPFLAIGLASSVAFVLKSIPLALTALYRWLHRDIESRQPMLGG